MAFKDLATDELVNLFTAWVNDKAARAAFLGVPEVAGIFGQVQRVYAGLVGTQPPATPSSPALVALLATEDETDGVHDELARATATILLGQQHYALGQSPPDHARHQALADANVCLFPNGMAFVTSNLRAEAGNAELVKRSLDANEAVQKTLKSIPVAKGVTLLDVAYAWLAAGLALGKLEDQRALLEAASAPKGPTPADRATARNAAIRLAGRLLDTLSDSDDASPEADAIRRRLSDALTLSNTRSRRAKAAAAAAAAGTGSAGPAQGATGAAGGPGAAS